MKWLDDFPLRALILMTVLMGLVPLVPEPYLWQKLKMLFAGTLSQPVDILYLVLCGTPAVLLVIKLLRLKHDTSERNE